MARKYDLAICGYYGFGNLGDELICRALVEMAVGLGLERSRICVLSCDPHLTGSSLGVDSVDRWNFFEVFKALRQSRSLLLGGGGLFQDSTSLRSCLYYWGVTLLGCLLGATPWAFGQSVGPLRSKTSRFLARHALKACRVRFVRDEASRDLLSSMGLDSQILPDPVFYFASCTPKNFRPGSVLALNIRPLSGGENTAGLLFQAVKAFCDARGYRTRAICLCEEDLLELRRLGERLDEAIVVKDIKDIASAFEDVRYAVGMRLHFCLLALLFRVPVVAVPYDPKVRSFALSWDIPLWEKGADLGNLISKAKVAQDDEINSARENLTEGFAFAIRKTLGDECVGARS